MAESAPRLFVHRRVITWSDSDPAGIAYTGQFPNFALQAIDAWFIDRLGMDWFEQHEKLGGGTPFVHVSMDFRSPLRPRDEVDTTVALAKAGRTSLEFRISGRKADGTLSYEGRFVCVFVEAATGRPRPAPAQFTEAIAREAALAKALLTPA